MAKTLAEFLAGDEVVKKLAKERVQPFQANVLFYCSNPSKAQRLVVRWDRVYRRQGNG